MTIDATIPGGLGTFGYDDEGVPSQRMTVVENGIFTGYLTDRQYATALGQRSNGTARARLPIGIDRSAINLWCMGGI